MFASKRLVAALLAAAFAAPLSAEPVTLDRVVAVVNKSVITERELAERIDNVVHNLKQQKVAAPPQDVLRTQVLERMVTERVLLDFALETGLRIDEQQLDRTVERIAEQNRLTVPQFRAALEKDGGNFARFRDEIRTELVVNRLREREIDSRVFVSDAEVDMFLKEQKTEGGDTVELEYKLSHIAIQLPEGASPEQISAKQRRAEAAAKALAAGKPFAEVAATFSEAPDSLSGGALGWRPAGRLPGLFLQALDQLMPGQSTPILRSPAGFHILKLEDKKSRDAREIIEQARTRHILVKVNELTSDSDALARIEQIRERLQKGAKFEDQAKAYSEDGTAQRGGDLGWLAPGDPIDPDFMKVVESVPLKQLSEPVRTQFGWHLIEVQERRTQDVTDERRRARTMNELRNRKADEQYEDWIKQMRDRAYVDLRLVEK
ncbi:peptidylprolyl isomerase [Chitinimonas lacunae]|uniref:Chaperone SurA n=1 Tax=Chitinimonas lacunae TaxID=1963018 RepID=A0ABV8MS85_9NEIS